MSRFECNKVVYSTDLIDLLRESENSHLYYNSVSCAKTVLDSGFLQFSVYFLGILFAVILF